MQQNTSKITELESKIADLKNSISELEGRLEHAREQAQHEAVDHLEDFINEVDTRFSSFQLFWQTLLEDLKK